jgi:ketosteroid isomerase-like protein
MSQENVDIVRTACEAWLRGDLDAMCETWHPEVEWDTTHFEGWVENKVYRGQDEVRRFLEEWMASWDRESYEASYEFLDKGEQIVLLMSQRMIGRGSGAPVKLDSAQVVTLRDGKVSRIDNYTDPDEALEAVGLPG